MVVTWSCNLCCCYQAARICDLLHASGVRLLVMRSLATRWLQSVPAVTASPHLGVVKIIQGVCCRQRHDLMGLPTGLELWCKCEKHDARVPADSRELDFSVRAFGLECLPSSRGISSREVEVRTPVVICTLKCCARHADLHVCDLMVWT